MYTNSIYASGNGIKIVAVDFQTEAGVTTFAGTAEVNCDGVLQDYSIKFGDPAPNSLNLAITDLSGLSIASRQITASTGRDNLGASLPVTGVRMTLSGNTTINAKGTAFFYFLV